MIHIHTYHASLQTGSGMKVVQFFCVCVKIAESSPDVTERQPSVSPLVLESTYAV